MQRTFVTNLLLLLVLNLLVKPLYLLGIDAGVQEAVGPATYGSYAALVSLSFLLNIVLDLGITNYNTRHIARHSHLMGKYLSGVAGLRLVLAGGYALVTLGVGVALGFQGAALTMLGWLVLNQALVAGLLYLRSNIAGAQRYRWDSLLSVLDRLLLIGGVGWLLWGRSSGHSFRIEWFVWAQTIAYGLTFLVALAMTLRLSGGARFGFNVAFSRVVLRQSFPYALLILLMTFYYRTDTLMLERVLDDGAYHAGVYAQGFRYFEAMNMIGYLFAGLLLPMFSRQLRHGQDVAPLALLALRLLLAGGLATAAFVHWHAGDLLALLYSDLDPAAAPSFRLLVHCFVGVSVTYVFGTLLTAAGDLRKLNYVAGGGALLNIVLNLLLIPRWQVEGAAWASLITQWLTALVQAFLASRAHRMAGLSKVVISALVFVALVMVAAYFTQGLALPLSGGIVALLALLLLPVSGLVGPALLRDAMKLPLSR
ncbi:MAG: polysaccharide biosynthesis C-terminal domain-containing protein [Flavobacteriales bacterium]